MRLASGVIAARVGTGFLYLKLLNAATGVHLRAVSVTPAGRPPLPVSLEVALLAVGSRGEVSRVMRGSVRVAAVSAFLSSRVWKL